MKKKVTKKRSNHNSRINLSRQGEKSIWYSLILQFQCRWSKTFWSLYWFPMNCPRTTLSNFHRSDSVNVIFYFSCSKLNRLYALWRLIQLGSNRSVLGNEILTHLIELDISTKSHHVFSLRMLTALRNAECFNLTILQFF